MSTFQHNLSILDNIPLQKIRVGDINIAYKQIGEGAPILLISGSGNVMDVWSTHFLQELSNGHKVIIFDNRGIGNTTSGLKPFSIGQFVDNTAAFECLEFTRNRCTRLLYGFFCCANTGHNISRKSKSPHIIWCFMWWTRRHSSKSSSCGSTFGFCQQSDQR
ncbi:protein of unknown function [Candidatus Nitrosocosmicus franklandus]|uniref:Uncharacterized protein n=1 Tax=Candidatus Nitrosocosmicus franklandianus TaxID=1798806 RepID=A0A484IAY3_9ARCH|nr:protein of unknown function [Candidatus Nitrosocosmicus franklandus]